MPDPADDRQRIAERTIGAYFGTLGSSDPTPGGGSAAGVVGALGASLGLMVVSLTSVNDDEAIAALAPAQDALVELRRRFTALAEEDEQVFQGYRDAAGMPKATTEEKRARKTAMQEALKHAADVPLRMCEAAVELAQALVPVQQHGSPHLLSDARIAMLFAASCFEASRINVGVNLAMIRDDPWVTDIVNRVESLADDLRKITAS